MAAAVAEHPDRLVGMGTVPLQNVEMAVAEMHRCLGILLAALASSYDLQLRRHHARHPEHERPERFGGEPF